MISFLFYFVSIASCFCVSIGQTEIANLNRSMKETEIAANRDRYLRDKTTTECDRVVGDNSRLEQEIIELKKQLDQVGQPFC